MAKILCNDLASTLVNFLSNSILSLLQLIRECPDFEWSCEAGAARLKIKQVTGEDEGTYLCEASNSLGKATSSACLVVYRKFTEKHLFHIIKVYIVSITTRETAVVFRENSFLPKTNNWLGHCRLESTSFGSRVFWRNLIHSMSKIEPNRSVREAPIQMNNVHTHR